MSSSAGDLIPKSRGSAVELWAKEAVNLIKNVMIQLTPNLFIEYSFQLFSPVRSSTAQWQYADNNTEASELLTFTHVSSFLPTIFNFDGVNCA